MKSLRLVLLFTITALLLSSVAFAQDMTYNEAPMLADKVAAGELPALADRLPAEPLVVTPIDSVGTYGGTWHMGSRGVGDDAGFTRTVGYYGLVRWNCRLDVCHSRCR